MEYCMFERFFRSIGKPVIISGNEFRRVNDYRISGIFDGSRLQIHDSKMPEYPYKTFGKIVRDIKVFLVRDKLSDR